MVLVKVALEFGQALVSHARFFIFQNELQLRILHSHGLKEVFGGRSGGVEFVFHMTFPLVENPRTRSPPFAAPVCHLPIVSSAVITGRQ